MYVARELAQNKKDTFDSRKSDIIPYRMHLKSTVVEIRCFFYLTNKKTNNFNICFFYGIIFLLKSFYILQERRNYE